MNLDIEYALQHNLLHSVINNTFVAGIHEGPAEDSFYATTNADTGLKKNIRPSLSKIILSLESTAEKRRALSHVLSALQISYARFV